VPFEVSTGPSAVPFFLPDGKHLAVVSAASATDPKRLWLVSLDGEAPRPIATLSESPVTTVMDLSSDGRSLVFTRPGTPTTTLLQADYSAALKR
jgi:Tol biopolymer transport system component